MVGNIPLNPRIRQAAILRQALEDEDNKNIDRNGTLAMAVFGIAFALEYALPNPNLKGAPTLNIDQQTLWDICFAIFGGCFPTLIFINIAIWFSKSIRRWVPQVNRHIRNLLRHVALIIAVNTILRGTLGRLHDYKWVYVVCTPIVLLVSYILAIKLKDAAYGVDYPDPQSLEVLSALHQVGLDDLPESIMPQPGCLRGSHIANLDSRPPVTLYDRLIPSGWRVPDPQGLVGD